jgi:hypothetical protein
VPRPPPCCCERCSPRARSPCAGLTAGRPSISHPPRSTLPPDPDHHAWSPRESRLRVRLLPPLVGERGRSRSDRTPRPGHPQLAGDRLDPLAQPKCSRRIRAIVSTTSIPRARPVRPPLFTTWAGAFYSPPITQHRVDRNAHGRRRRSPVLPEIAGSAGTGLPRTETAGKAHKEEDDPSLDRSRRRRRQSTGKLQLTKFVTKINLKLFGYEANRRYRSQWVAQQRGLGSLCHGPAPVGET